MLTITSLLLNFAFVLSLRLENVTIPEYSVKDGKTSLFCDYNLEQDKLLVLKWYKDEKEFFRYVPPTPAGHHYEGQSNNNIVTFPVEGVHVSVPESQQNHVVLRNISLKSSGTYRCEVSADLSFRTLSIQRNMTVIAPPTSDPEISGIRPVVSVGDKIEANCTSFQSQPAASLMFYINEEKAESSELREFPVLREPEGLETSFLGLYFLIEPRHLKGGTLELKCTATMGNSYRVKKISLSEANINAQPSIPGHDKRSGNRAIFSGSSPQFSSRFISIFLLISPNLLNSFVLSS